MSLSRLALRLAAYEALNPYATSLSGPWPTLAGGNVYDSRVTPIAGEDGWGPFLTEIEGRPLVTIYTEETEVDPTVGEYPADKEMADLVIEMQIAAMAEIEVVGADGVTTMVGQLAAPVTSREHEALLDVLEAQVRHLLNPQGNAPSGWIYRKNLARELHHVHSVPQRDPEKVMRFAARTLRLKVRVPLTVWPQLQKSPPPTGLDVLPEPLRRVACQLDPQSTGGRLCAKIAGMIAPPVVPTPLTDVRIYVGVDRGVTPTAADADVTGGVQFSQQP
jgi:hypothetical protein